MRARPAMAVSVLVVSILAVVRPSSPRAAAPAANASSAFWSAWGDGKAELSGYEITTSRYGAPREGTLVLVFVTEPMDRRVWVKDDAGDVPAADRVNVMKLNAILKFQTGIYPYSVMTSTFAPVDPAPGERFAPAKVVLSAQEWCGSVYERLLVRPGSFDGEVRSYFHAEGDRERTVTTAPGTLYEDALLIQLRELDGPFASGRSWNGMLVPSLWSSRKAHTPLDPVAASIRRASATRDGIPVQRFTVTYAGTTRTIDVEKAAPHRILGWTASDGEVARILKTARLPYWQLHGPGDEKYLAQLGLGGSR
jgi:hypothetical protein